MITDRQHQVSAAQALTSGTIIATDAIDLGQARDVGAGEMMFLVINVDTTFTGGTSVQPQIITGTGVSTTINAGVQVLGSLPALTAAQLVAGALFVFPVPERNPQDRGARYLGVQYVMVGTFGAGALTASFVKGSQHINKQYTSGFVIN